MAPAQAKDSGISSRIKLHLKKVDDHDENIPVPRVSPKFTSSFPPFLLFSFCYWLYLFSSFVHPFPFYQTSPTPFPGRRS